MEGKAASAVRKQIDDSWRKLNDLTFALHSCRTPEAAARVLLTQMRGLIAFDSASVQDDRGGIDRIPWLFPDSSFATCRDSSIGMRMMTHWDPEFTTMREAFFAASGERHPQTEFYRRTGDGSARRLSDLVPMRALMHTTFYNEISRKNQLRWQLTTYIQLQSAGTLTIALCRRGLDFAEKDRRLLQLVRPHIELAWSRLIEAEQNANVAASCIESNIDLLEARLDLRRLGLTRREAEVLLWVASGKTNPEIGIILGLTRGTVKFYVERILAKLKVETRTAAARLAYER